MAKFIDEVVDTGRTVLQALLTLVANYRGSVTPEDTSSLRLNCILQRHNAENFETIIPRKGIARPLRPNFHIHVSLSVV